MILRLLRTSFTAHKTDFFRPSGICRRIALLAIVITGLSCTASKPSAVAFDASTPYTTAGTNANADAVAGAFSYYKNSTDTKRLDFSSGDVRKL